MAYCNLYFRGFNQSNNYNRYFVDIDEKTYIFTLRWNNYAKTAFLSISDYEDNAIISGKPLVNGLKIRNNKLPYTFYFLQKDGKNYEPTLENFSNEFTLIYDDEEKP